MSPLVVRTRRAATRILLAAVDELEIEITVSNTGDERLTRSRNDVAIADAMFAGRRPNDHAT